jgi:beta-lactam-binding protein with PASTA domain
VPKVVGLTRTSASKRLKARRCALGKVTTKYYKPRRVKKGRSRITVRYRRGRVVTQRVKPGAKVASGTKVRVTVQGRKPRR